MTPEIAAHYEALELQPNASEQDVKRAYFRLVRKYTPEKDPERFQRIRAAYEYLKDSPAEAPSPDYKMPEDPIARFNIESAMEMMQKKRFDNAAKLYQEALDYAPDSPIALIGLATALSRGGKPQKAAKTAERLTQLCPNDSAAHALLARSLYSRGWYKKAMPAFRRAYQLGVRELTFLSDYAEAAKENRFVDESVQIAREMLAFEKWNRDNIYYALVAYITIFSQASFHDQKLTEWTKNYSDFVIRHWRLFESGEAPLAPIFSLFDDNICSFVHGDYSIIEAALDRISQAVPSWNREIDLLRSLALEKALMADPRGLHEDWQLLNAYFSDIRAKNISEGICHYDKLSAQLCFLKDWAAVSPEIPIIQKDYPNLYAQCRDFLEKAETTGPDILFTRLKREFDKLSKRYEGSVYQKRYPEEYAPAGRVISGGDDFVPYVRTNAKVGANDPCPCGSGRKFKKCCMGTGKYD